MAQQQQNSVHPLLGYLLLILGVSLFAFNASVAKLVMQAALGAPELTAIRITGAFLVLLPIAFFRARPYLKVSRQEIPKFIGFGVLGLTMTQFLYFAALERIEVGLAIIIEYLSPIIVALYLRFWRKQFISPRVWLSIVLALFGLSLITDIWSGFDVDILGFSFAFGAAIAVSIYFLGGEVLVRQRGSIALTTLAMGVGAGFWLIFSPFWLWSWELFANTIEISQVGIELPIYSLLIWVAVMGAVAPFWLVFTAMKYIDAKKAAILGLLEPVIASLVAFILLGEILSTIQLIGGAIVLIGVTLAETARQ
ncbi:MAG: EamA family transporter [Candidatus Nanopelagicales bacterium]|jgi:drug/metabolite transporter (DMT)-like permease